MCLSTVACGSVDKPFSGKQRHVTYLGRGCGCSDRHEKRKHPCVKVKAHVKNHQVKIPSTPTISNDSQPRCRLDALNQNFSSFRDFQNWNNGIGVKQILLQVVFPPTSFENILSLFYLLCVNFMLVHFFHFSINKNAVPFRNYQFYINVNLGRNNTQMNQNNTNYKSS